MERPELTDQHWEQRRPLLPPERSGKMRHPYKGHRQVSNGIPWILATGTTWRDLPEHYRPWSTVANRLYDWPRAGIWQHMLATIQQEGDRRGEVDWSLHFVDGTVIRAHQHAAGAQRKHGEPALGRSRGGLRYHPVRPAWQAAHHAPHGGATA